jgi:hypothetical protein
MAATNTLAYYDMATITALMSPEVLATALHFHPGLIFLWRASSLPVKAPNLA